VKGRFKHKTTREKKKGKRQHRQDRLLEYASKWEAGELEKSDSKVETKLAASTRNSFQEENTGRNYNRNFKCAVP
jgi:hypothetical protein